ncbi:MAG TPA: SDR family oxidoreductase [Candidatus Acidoferrales bacterium]|nr:SDR family oxidoreductase [Candidatus Acidoferrales bacterium]
MDLHLKGKVAMISGASHGLGRAVARELAAEGCRVSMASRNEAAIRSAASRISRETGASVFPFAADVRVAHDLEAWYRGTLGEFGGVDLLFPNAGGPPPGEAGMFDDAAWQAGFELLVLSVIRMVRLAVGSMAGRGGGSIVIPTSTSVKQPIPNLGLSNVLRASVAALAKSLASELAPRNIRVNHLLPGRISTERLAQIDEAASRQLGIPLDEQRRRSIAQIPLARYGEPEEFARAAAFLFSGAASYITGASLQVDGGAVRAVL